MAKATFRHSDEAFNQVDNIVEGSNHLENKSDFYQTVTDYALEKATDGDYESEIDDFEDKVEELGLDQLSSSSLEHFDFASAVYIVTHDESKPVEDRMEYLQKLSEEELGDHFSGSNVDVTIDYLE